MEEVLGPIEKQAVYPRLGSISGHHSVAGDTGESCWSLSRWGYSLQAHAGRAATSGVPWGKPPDPHLGRVFTLLCITCTMETYFQSLSVCVLGWGGVIILQV